MKLQIFSDLHFDVAPVKKIAIADDVDVVIVAGDTCERVLRAFGHLRRLVPLRIPIVMTMGNHEFYRGFIPDELTLARSHGPAFNIHVLENDTVTLADAASIGRVRFVGATLWTDYQIFGEVNQTAVMNACANGMNDHRLIGWQKQPWRRFRPQEAAQLHHKSKAFIAETLALPFSGPTVVVSHHAVHWNSIEPRFHSDPTTGAYLSDQSELIETFQPALWVHGHVHNSSNYFIGRTRIVCNPSGYGNENTIFDSALTVEVDI